MRDEEALINEQRMRREAEDLKEAIFSAEKEKVEARKDEEEKWKAKLDDVLKVSSTDVINGFQFQESSFNRSI